MIKGKCKICKALLEDREDYFFSLRLIPTNENCVTWFEKDFPELMSNGGMAKFTFFICFSCFQDLWNNYPEIILNLKRINYEEGIV